MRIIGGEFGGRLLVAPRRTLTRPSASRVREGLASALEARGMFANARVIDLFAGTGALGLEALSRGAATLVAVDQDPAAVRCIIENARTLGVAHRVHALKLDLLARPAVAAARLGEHDAAPFTLAFVDAPYAQLDHARELVAQLASADVFASGAVVAVEHPANRAPQSLPALATVSAYRYGDTGVTLFEVAPPART